MAEERVVTRRQLGPPPQDQFRHPDRPCRAQHLSDHALGQGSQRGVLRQRPPCRAARVEGYEERVAARQRHDREALFRPGRVAGGSERVAEVREDFGALPVRARLRDHSFVVSIARLSGPIALVLGSLTRSSARVHLLHGSLRPVPHPRSNADDPGPDGRDLYVQPPGPAPARARGGRCTDLSGPDRDRRRLRQERAGHLHRTRRRQPHRAHAPQRADVRPAGAAQHRVRSRDRAGHRAVRRR